MVRYVEKAKGKEYDVEADCKKFVVNIKKKDDDQAYKIKIVKDNIA